MLLRRCFASLLFVGLTLGAAQPAASVPVAVAAAASLRGTLEELGEAFQKENAAVRLQISYGASGSLVAQIKQGAPFDVFLSADLDYPEQLVQAGLATKEGIARYATGKLVLWVRKGAAGSEGMSVLASPAIKRISLANPRLAPYGRAGEEALKKAGLYDAVQARLVFGENIAQAAQYLQTGVAEAGFIALAQTTQKELKDTGRLWIVPQELYTPLLQGGVVLARTAHREEAKAFLGFLRSPEGQAILTRNGFGKP